ncbi:hypothetical protein ACLSZR_02435 [Avibacterium avium]|uniref:hypothetical protein n=1 Tax=Avibacterium avium TaxID=751 RepID=UPI003BF89B33
MVGKHIDSEFEQLKYTFSSILASVNYIDLYGNDLLSIYFDQDIINFYISFILSLEMDLKDINNSYMFSNHLVGELSTRAKDLIYIMRKSAWEAAKRYVSISLTDRKLDTSIFRR